MTEPGPEPTIGPETVRIVGHIYDWDNIDAAAQEPLRREAAAFIEDTWGHFLGRGPDTEAER